MYDYPLYQGFQVIASFADLPTRALFDGSPRHEFRTIPPNIHASALRKLDMLNAAAVLGDLRAPPGNRLEALKGNKEGFHSIRVNDPWRIIFRWQGSDALLVQIIDYH